MTLNTLDTRTHRLAHLAPDDRQLVLGTLDALIDSRLGPIGDQLCRLLGDSSSDLVELPGGLLRPHVALLLRDVRAIATNASITAFAKRKRLRITVELAGILHT